MNDLPAASDRAAPGQTRPRVVLVTGLSGAGKASILRALEDIGYEAIDNPPFELIESMVGGNGSGRRVAVGVDARSRGFNADAVIGVMDRLRQNPALRSELVFATADETVLLRRYTETRRRHPLSPHGRVGDGIAAEQSLTAPIREIADWVIDTSELSLAVLRQRIDARFNSAAADASTLAVSVQSFAYPSGLPREADLVFDARFLRNPYYDMELRPLTGQHPAVAAYVEADPDFEAVFQRIADLLAVVLPRFVQEGKKYATIAIGCTGGRHRSVALAEKLAARLSAAGWRVSLVHRELARAGATASPIPDPAVSRTAGPIPSRYAT